MDSPAISQAEAFPPLSKRLAERLANVGRLLVLTGAGISAESGIPTFRGTGGIWNDWNPDDYATPEAFARDPVRVWQWYRDRRVAIHQAQPNPGHLALAALEARLPGTLIATQNIDGMHQRAGSCRVVEIHGSIDRCRPIHSDHEFSLDGLDLADGKLPPCDASGCLLRPAVVWFGEMLPLGPIEEIEHFLSEPPDLVLLVGTMASFPYIQNWALRPQSQRALFFEVNLDPTPLTPLADAVWHAPAGRVLPWLAERIGPRPDA
jgi:NAD-dependent deacetylase